MRVNQINFTEKTMIVKTRWQAFGLHLLISLVLFLGIAFVILFIWYPNHFRYFGGLKGVGMIGAIDLILGPLLTLLVFNTTKKHLKWDLTAIGLVQLSALGFGAWSVHQGKPLAQVLTHQGVYIVTYSDLTLYPIKMSDVQKMGSNLPTLVYLDVPESLELANQAVHLTEAIDGKPFALRTDLFLKYNSKLPKLIKDQLKIKAKPKNCTVIKLLSNSNGEQVCFELSTGAITPIKK
jgi:hypothetical protein